MNEIFHYVKASLKKIITAVDKPYYQDILICGRVPYFGILAPKSSLDACPLGSETV